MHVMFILFINNTKTTPGQQRNNLFFFFFSFFVQEGICDCYEFTPCVQLQHLLQQKNDMFLR